MLPPGYLQAVYEEMRAEGALCVADEVSWRLLQPHGLPVAKWISDLWQHWEQDLCCFPGMLLLAVRGRPSSHKTMSSSTSCQLDARQSLDRGLTSTRHTYFEQPRQIWVCRLGLLGASCRWLVILGGIVESALQDWQVPGGLAAVS